MTTIACWFNKEQCSHSIWVCGDSKISSSGTTLLESGAKIFSIPVLCFGQGTSGFFDKAVFHTRVGLAYAGSSLVGLNLNAALSTCLSRLNTFSRPPAMSDIAVFASKLLRLYISQLAISSGSGAHCEIALIGYCPIEEELKIYHLRPSVDSGDLEYIVDPHSCNSTSDEFVLLLGADKERIGQQIEMERQSLNGICWWRAPKNVVYKEIQELEHPSIGGHMQLGICNYFGFDNYLLGLPGRNGSSEAYISYLGLDVMKDIGNIGGCFVGIPCML